jgi:hypothetical protein
MKPSDPSFATGDFTLARTGNLALPMLRCLKASSPSNGFPTATVSILHRGLTATTANQNVKQRNRDSKFLLGKQGAASPPRPEGEGFQRGEHR